MLGQISIITHPSMRFTKLGILCFFIALLDLSLKGPRRRLAPRLELLKLVPPLLRAVPILAFRSGWRIRVLKLL